MGAVSLGVARVAMIWLKHSNVVTGMLLAGLFGAIGVFATLVIFKALKRGIVFRPYSG